MERLATGRLRHAEGVREFGRRTLARRVVVLPLDRSLEQGRLSVDEERPVVVGNAQVSLGGGSGRRDTTTLDETATPTPAPTPTAWSRTRSRSRGARATTAGGTPSTRLRSTSTPGTTVVWRWVDDAVHDVVDSNGMYESPDLAAKGATYAVEFDGHGLSTYPCEPHDDRGIAALSSSATASESGRRCLASR